MVASRWSSRCLGLRQAGARGRPGHGCQHRQGRAVGLPLKQIAIHAGLEGGVVAEKVASLPAGQGLNAATGEYVDLLANGIIDPAKVTRLALQNAAFIAALVLTTEAVVADKPEKAAPAGDPQLVAWAAWTSEFRSPQQHTL